MRGKKTIKKLKAWGFVAFTSCQPWGQASPSWLPGFLLTCINLICVASCCLVQVALIAGATQSLSVVVTDGPTTGPGCVPSPVVSFCCQHLTK